MIVSVSGFGWTGSSAVYDILKEYDDVKIAVDAHKDFEFPFLYTVDGIRDLEYHLCDNPHRISSYVAIGRYLRLVQSYADRLHSLKQSEQLVLLTQEYIDSLTDFRLEWKYPFELRHHDSKPFITFYNRSVIKILANRFAKKVLGDLYNKLVIYIPYKCAISYRPQLFHQKTKDYIRKVFALFQDERGLPLVFNQLLTPDNPLPYLKYLDNPKCIVVRRDPRDIYILAKCVYKSKIPIPVSSVDDFISYYKKIVGETMIEERSDFLNIYFEDIIYDYADTLKKIEAFLGINSHICPYSFFKPSVSVNNTQLFLKYEGYEDDIEIIEKELTEYLYPFANYSTIETTSNKVF